MEKNNSSLTKNTVKVVEETITNDAVETKETETLETKDKTNESEGDVTSNDDEKTQKESEVKEEKVEDENKTEEEKKRTVPAVLKNSETPLLEQKEKTTPPLELKNLDVDFAFDILSVPTYSKAEYRMVTRIVLWARANNVKYEFDTYGNIYLTKGELGEGEYYPCVTSHLDTVQNNQEIYAQLGMPLTLKERVNDKGGHELYIDGMGIGADDKAGVLISLSLFKYFDKLKACFFLEEEVGMKGSEQLNKEWFDNVGYVIGWDSPDRNRAAFASSQELLFGKEFFEKIEDTCKEHGVTDFRSEPFTDVVHIRKKTEVVCMNFGNGGYNAHASNEYVILEDVDGALGLGIALIELLGTEKFRMKSKKSGWYASTDKDEDSVYLNKRFNSYYSNSRTYGGYHYSSGTNTTTTTTKTEPSRNTTSFKDDDKVDSKVLSYVVDRYEKHISNIANKVEEREAIILKGIKQLCEEGVTDYQKYLDLFCGNLSFEPFSTAIEF